MKSSLQASAVMLRSSCAAEGVVRAGGGCAARGYGRTGWPTSTSVSLAQLYSCHALPAETVRKVARPRRCTANGTAAVT